MQALAHSARTRRKSTCKQIHTRTCTRALTHAHDRAHLDVPTRLTYTVRASSPVLDAHLASAHALARSGSFPSTRQHAKSTSWMLLTRCATAAPPTCARARSGTPRMAAGRRTGPGRPVARWGQYRAT